MEIKWIMTAAAVIFTAMFTAVAVDKYSESQCKQAYIQSDKTAADIIKICTGK
jgi:hypothetical protein